MIWLAKMLQVCGRKNRLPFTVIPQLTKGDPVDPLGLNKLPALNVVLGLGIDPINLCELEVWKDKESGRISYHLSC